ncbi:hypothetical protein E4U15_003458 [Claviceps sp. LM218 group G6]|nr:hypothetical protein E4U15_003458 [Claviceps sp. LM218 group G6]
MDTSSADSDTEGLSYQTDSDAMDTLPIVVKLKAVEIAPFESDAFLEVVNLTVQKLSKRVPRRPRVKVQVQSIPKDGTHLHPGT